MGYPEPHYHNTLSRFSFRLSLVLLLCFSFPSLEAVASDPPALSGLPPGQWDHVVITHPTLLRAFNPLAAHRLEYGLNSRVFTTSEILQWSVQTNLRDAIRWFISAAQQEWGTRYVLLGGGAEVIPVPLGYFEGPTLSWDIPLDLYYAAPNGDWDMDGDGILGEIGQDDPDLTPVVAVGRAPVADAAQTRAFVDKVIAFETQDASALRDVLLVAEVGNPFPWVPGQEIIYDFAWNLEEVVEILASLEFFGAFDRLYQNWIEYPGAYPLTPEAFLQALNNGHHRFLSLLIHGIDDTWSLGTGYLGAEDLIALEEMDHSLFAVPGVPMATDCRNQAVLKRLMVLPHGGCVGAMGPSSMFYFSPGNMFFEGFWREIVDHPLARVGDAYRATLENLLGQFPPNSWALTTLQCMSIYGDPALSLLPLAPGGLAPERAPEAELCAAASPNPFNPATEISFVIPGAAGDKVPTLVDIFDLGGRRLTRLVEDTLEPGPHAVRWRGTDASGRPVGSGLFFARVLAADQRAVVKLILVE